MYNNKYQNKYLDDDREEEDAPNRRQYIPKAYQNRSYATQDGNPSHEEPRQFKSSQSHANSNTRSYNSSSGQAHRSDHWNEVSQPLPQAEASNGSLNPYVKKYSDVQFDVQQQRGYQQNRQSFQISEFNGPPPPQVYQYRPFIYEFKMQFPRLNNYYDILALRQTFEPLRNLHPAQPIQLSSNDIVKLIRPNGTLNLHKAIKYGIWTSLGSKNLDLVESWQIAKRQGGRVYLLFLPLNRKGQEPIIVGLAEMKSQFDHLRHFKFWDREHYYFGTCGIEWHYVRHMPTQNVAPFLDKQSKTQYRIEQLRDGTILEYTDAKPIVSDYFKIPDNPSIFDEFPALDTDEDKMRQHRANFMFEEKFKAAAATFEQQFQVLPCKWSDDDY